MKLAEIRDLIRAEAGIEGEDTNRVLIDNFINQELMAYTGKSKYEELRDTITFTTTADEEHDFTLPDNYQLFDSLVYHKFGSEFPASDIILSKGTLPRYTLPRQGPPQYANRVAGVLRIYPYLDILINDTFTLSYFKKVTLIEDDEDFPVESLERPVILSSVARALKMKDTQKGLVAAADAHKAYLETRSQNAGN